MMHRSTIAAAFLQLYYHSSKQIEFYSVAHNALLYYYPLSPLPIDELPHPSYPNSFTLLLLHHSRCNNNNIMKL